MQGSMYLRMPSPLVLILVRMNILARARASSDSASAFTCTCVCRYVWSLYASTWILAIGRARVRRLSSYGVHFEFELWLGWRVVLSAQQCIEFARLLGSAVLAIQATRSKILGSRLWSCVVLSDLVWSCPVLLCLILACLVLACLIWSYLIWFCLVLS